MTPLPNSSQHKWNFSIHDASYYQDALVDGDRSALSQLISLGEGNTNDSLGIVYTLLNDNKASWIDNQSIRIGVTGPPGVGKSTFIEKIGLHLGNNNNKVAVLTVDPSSQESKGAILGDKTRMPQLSVHDNAYVRPSASGKQLGGLNSSISSAVLLCETAGYNIIIIESVGVGQNEIDIKNYVDKVILLEQPGAGDELQGIKKGILEIADFILVNKADKHLEPLAQDKVKALKSSIKHAQIESHSNMDDQIPTCIESIIRLEHKSLANHRSDQLKTLLIKEAELTSKSLVALLSKNLKNETKIPLGYRIELLDYIKTLNLDS